MAPANLITPQKMGSQWLAWGEMVVREAPDQDLAAVVEEAAACGEMVEVVEMPGIVVQVSREGMPMIIAEEEEAEEGMGQVAVMAEVVGVGTL